MSSGEVVKVLVPPCLVLIVRRLKSWCPRAGLKSERFMHVKPPHALMELHRGKQYITTGITGLWLPSVHRDIAF